jgi:putative oxygen-independent coproporphyrinogen III oxidase
MSATAASPRSDVQAFVLPAERIKALIMPGTLARKNKSLLLYIHVPFCSSKCHFCDWVVGYDTRDLVDKSGDLRDAYVEALCTQIDAYAPMLEQLGYSVTNIYWGGGTPTRLSPHHITRICEQLQRHLSFDQVLEHTAECSPETLTPEHLAVWKACGLNRLSIGVQAYDSETLRRIGRSHSVDHVHQAIKYVREAGIENFNIDLITGLPQQGGEESAESVQQAIAAGIPHISLYMFRDHADDLSAVRRVKSGRISQRSKEERAQSYHHETRLLEEAGYEQYIVGYFTKEPRYRFDSEDYYFSMRGDYFGFGAGAASVIGRHALKSGDPARYGNSNVRDFIAQPTNLVACALNLGPDGLFTDGFFKAFATKEGVNYARWRDLFGFDFQKLCEARPGIRAWFEDRRAGGAAFEETADHTTLTSETWLETMIWRR